MSPIKKYIFAVCNRVTVQEKMYYRFSRTFSSPFHSISSVFNSISSGDSFCVQILSSISSHCHSYSSIVNQIQTFGIEIRQLSLKFVSAAKRVRNVRINFVIMSHKFTIWSFKFVKPVNCFMDFYFDMDFSQVFPPNFIKIAFHLTMRSFIFQRI